MYMHKKLLRGTPTVEPEGFNALCTCCARGTTPPVARRDSLQLYTPVNRLYYYYL